jgi:AcrR family transcriptional regulator
MPRIAAASIDEHVRQQMLRITAAARRLFARDGFTATDLGSIAAEVGLARNSLYRYVASKDELLLACIREDMAPYIAQLASLASVYPAPCERIIAMLNLQFDLAIGPAHATMELMNEVRDSSRALRNEVAHLHTAPNELLEQALVELHGSKHDCGTQAAMIGGMLMAATGRAVYGKKKYQESIRSELLNAVRAVLSI